MVNMSEKRILIVDDEPAILDIMRQAFEMNGYKVFSAQNAEKAIEINSETVIMVMFLDLKLPGMDGMALCKRIRRDNQIAVIYAVTGYTNFFGVLECRSAGFDDFFVKPVDIPVLLRAARHAFEKLERWKFDYNELKW
jgi:DNA-binding response OmpR family regulator